MGLRYRVKQKLDTKGHSAVLVLAEVSGQNPHRPSHNVKLNHRSRYRNFFRVKL